MRKGELSKGQLDKGWPHQVAMLAARCTGEAYVQIQAFCRDLSLAPRGHTFVRDDAYHIVFCFADKAHAEAFAARFGGCRLEPSERPAWPGRARKRR